MGHVLQGALMKIMTRAPRGRKYRANTRKGVLDLPLSCLTHANRTYARKLLLNELASLSCGFVLGISVSVLTISPRARIRIGLVLGVARAELLTPTVLK